MGSCCSSQSRQETSERNNLDRNKSQRQNNWTATGTIALRDSKLKVSSTSLSRSTTQQLASCLRSAVAFDQVWHHLQALPGAALAVGPAARVLDATNNSLTYLPDQINNLTNLTRLILASNQLHFLPPCLPQLVSLKASSNLILVKCMAACCAAAATVLVHFVSCLLCAQDAQQCSRQHKCALAS